MEQMDGAQDSTSGLKALPERIGEQERLDKVAVPLSERLSPLSQGKVGEILSGAWLGHPLHPMLTDVVIGSWTSGLFLDLLGKSKAEGARALVGIGALAAVPTAVAGLHDWLGTKGSTRRVGVVHASGNTLALYLQVLSYQARKHDKRGTGILLSLLANGVLTVSGYLGAHLTYRRGVGVG